MAGSSRVLAPYPVCALFAAWGTVVPLIFVPTTIVR